MLLIIIYLQLLCSYLFWPIVFLMGVVPNDCFIVARMVGVKTFINEFFAYADLGTVRKNRIELTKYLAANPNATIMQNINGDVLIQGTNVTFSGGIISVSTSTRHTLFSIVNKALYLSVFC